VSAICRFCFPVLLSREDIEAQLALAVVAAECAFGAARVRIGGGYSISEGENQAEQAAGVRVGIDVSTEVGERIAEVFAGLMLRQLGEDEFTVERAEAGV